MHVPDDRFKFLCKHFHPKSEVSATLSIFDIAGLVPGAHKGDGLGNAFLSHIQAVDGIFHVVRAFDDGDIVHSEGEVNPVNDLETISSELRLKDIERCDRLIDDAQKSLNRNAKDKHKQFELEVLKKARCWLDEKWVSEGNWKTQEVEVLNEHQFLTAKQVVYLVNMSEKDFSRQKNKWLAKISSWVEENQPGPVIPYSASFETNLLARETEAEKEQYMKEIGVQKSMVEKIIRTGFSALNLIYFFTCGEDEVKCWTIRQHTKAPQAAGTIHTDFERGFICAEVYKYTDLVDLGSEAALKAAGKYQHKGKEYVVDDGDVIFFKFNVTATATKK
eukprot:GHVS01103912.1.p1 GENE.GHVS01103912.1~~GHVS01103912.1.p1  ORF type:complete len:391 (+),score=50.98 GHVS01103912.1:177-1175(+)